MNLRDAILEMGSEMEKDSRVEVRSWATSPELQRLHEEMQDAARAQNPTRNSINHLHWPADLVIDRIKHLRHS